MSDRPATSARCGPAATARGDSMLGTAFPADRVLLIEQPGGWGISGLTDSRLDPAVARRLLAITGVRGIRVLAIRRPGRAPAPARRRWGFADTRAGRRALVWGEFENDADLLDLEVDGLAGREWTDNDNPSQEPVYLVCAHGTHDTCCAIEGRPVAEALNRVRPGQVWECSHLGGDRFAANVLVLPFGALYGRVPPARAEDLAAATDRAQVLPELLRGQVGHAPAVQAALVHAREQLQRYGLDDLRVLDHYRSSDRDTPGPQLRSGEAVQVRIASPDYVVLVTVQIDRVAEEQLTCRAGRPNSSLRYRPTDLEIF